MIVIGFREYLLPTRNNPSDIPRLMCGVFPRLSHALIAAVLAVASPLSAQQTSGTFRWIDFHDPKDQNIVAWIARSLQVEK